MSASEVIKHLLELTAGVGTFLVACEMMSENLQAISSKKLKKLFAKISDHKIASVCIGAIACIAMQSSGATNVMVMGFANAGIVSLHQAVNIVLGTEIGTTLTAQIVALGLFGDGTISATTIFAALIGVGAVMSLIVKEDRSKKFCGIMIGFGMVFVGLSMMSSAMDSFAQLQALKDFLASIDSILIMIMVGTLLTAAVQSSTAVTTVSITMIAAGLITLEQGIYLTLGANIGSCITGLLAALSSRADAKRISLLQVIFNVGGVIGLALLDLMIKLFSGNALSVSRLFEIVFQGVPQIQLAMFHAIFNIVSVLVTLPFTEKLADLTCRMIKDDDEKAAISLKYFDMNMLSSPAIAVEQLRKEIVEMSQIAMENFNLSIHIISSLDFTDEEKFKANENELNYLNENLVKIVTALSKKTINAKDYSYLSSTYRAISDFERIGDYSENIVEYARYLADHQEAFNTAAVEEINAVREVINDLYEITMEIYRKYSKDKFRKAGQLEEKVDRLTEQMAINHIQRLNSGECKPDVGCQYLQLSSDVERIADHLININDKDFVLSH